MSPVFYILISMAVTNVILTLVFFIAWQGFGRARHALTWSLTFAFATTQWLTNLARDQLPSFEFYWILVTAITLVVISLGLLGHLQRCNKRVSAWHLSVPAIIALLAVSWFTIFDPHKGLQSSITPLYASLTLGLSAWLIIQHRERSTIAEIGAAATIGIFGVLQFLAGSVALAQGAQTDAALTQAYYALNFVGMPAAYTGMGLFVVLMIASDLAEQLRELARRDQLTGLLNRRGFGERSAAAYQHARFAKTPVAVIMTDIDHFKAINDQWGHQVGDHAIEHFAGILRRGRRSADVLARIGGEEFALILPGVSLEAGLEISRRLCQDLRERPLRLEDKTVGMTASFGVAALSDKDTCLSDAICRADDALYQSKRSGRDRVDLVASQVFLTEQGLLSRGQP